MANKLIAEMGLPKPMSNLFAARNVLTAKEALSLTEFELMELLDVGLAEVTSAVSHISELTCPPFQTAHSLMEERIQNEHLSGHLPTRLKGLDDALCGGIPFGVLTELVGPAGIGKTQFCLKLSLLAALPVNHGGLNGRVIYIDTESKFSSKRMIEIGAKSFPELFHVEGMAQEMAGRILVLRPASLSDFAKRPKSILKMVSKSVQKQLDEIDRRLQILEAKYGIKPKKEEADDSPPKTEDLGMIIFTNATTTDELLPKACNKSSCQFFNTRLSCSLLTVLLALYQGNMREMLQDNIIHWVVIFLSSIYRSLAEFSRIPIVVTNQVRSQCSGDRVYSFQGPDSHETFIDHEKLELHLVAALGIHWAHAVTIRLVLEGSSGQRFIKVTKSPISPPLAFPFVVTSSGISLLSDEGIEVEGDEINTIHCQGYADIINFNREQL